MFHLPLTLDSRHANDVTIQNILAGCVRNLKEKFCCATVVSITSWYQSQNNRDTLCPHKQENFQNCVGGSNVMKCLFVQVGKYSYSSFPVRMNNMN